MSTERELTRIVRSWLRDDDQDSADRVLFAVLDQLDTTPQRRVTWWPARRNSTMNAIIRYGVAAAVLAIAALIGINVLGNGSGTGAGGPTPEPTPLPTPTPASTPTSSPEGLLPRGPHTLNDGQDLESAATLLATVTIPADGWYGETGGGILLKYDTADAPDGAGMITFFGEFFVYGDPCRWSTTRPETPVATVDEFMAALAAQASRDASEPIDVTIDSHAGKAVTLHVPDDLDFRDCDRVTFGSWGQPGPDATPMRYHQDPGQIDEVYAVDVGGTLAVINIAYYEGTPQEVVDELHAIVDSIRFPASSRSSR